MSIHDYKAKTDYLTECANRLLELEDSFMYAIKDLDRAEQIIFEATEIYYDANEKLNQDTSYEHYDEFDVKIKDSYTFMTCNYFRFKAGK